MGNSQTTDHQEATNMLNKKRGRIEQEEHDTAPVDENEKKRIKVNANGQFPAKGGTYYSIFGENARPKVHLKLAEYARGKSDPSLEIRDVQDLFMWILIRDMMPPRWVFVQNKALVRKVVVIVINSLDLDTYVAHQAELDSLAAIGTQTCVVHAPWTRHQQNDKLITGDRSHEFWKRRMLSGLFKRKKPKKKKTPPQNHNSLAGTMAVIKSSECALELTSTSYSSDGNDDEDGDGDNDNGNGSTNLAQNSTSNGKTYTSLDVKEASKSTVTCLLRPEDLLLSVADLKENDYPIELEEDFVETMDAKSPYNDKMIAVDCEMCITADGMELTRVTLVDELGNCIYDKYVKPDNQITNYNTRFSGITEAHLANVTTRLRDVQTDILQIVTKKTILVGHSLENDLRSLKIVHWRVIDTSIIYPHHKGQRYKNALRFLAFQHLSRKIQTNPSGHDSIEDALTALDLVKLKLERGIDYGSTKSNLISVFSMLNDHDKRAMLIDEPNCLNSLIHPSISSASCLSDDEAVHKATGPCKSETYQFVFVHLHDLEKHYASQNAQHKSELSKQSKTDDLKTTLSKTNQRIKTIYDALPENSLCIVTSPYGNLHDIAKSIKDKGELQEWKHIDAQNAVIQKTIDRTSSGLCFIGIKSQAEDS